MITSTLGHLAAVDPILRDILKRGVLTPQAKYHVAKLARLVANELPLFYEERDRLLHDLATEYDGPDGGRVKGIRPGTKEMFEFHRNLKAYADVAVTIDGDPLRSTELPQEDGTVWVDLGPFCDIVEPDAFLKDTDHVSATS